MIRSRAAVAWGPGQELQVMEIDVAPPKRGEVLVRIVATGVCHTDREAAWWRPWGKG